MSTPGNFSVASVAEVMQGENEDLREALVSVDPKTGAIRAYYGGGTDFDYARAQRQPGSSVKPYVLATALEQGISVTARRDGSSPQTFPDRPEKPVKNSGGASCADCTLKEAITRSLNTTFYGLSYELGPENVRQTILKAAGLPEIWQSGQFEGDKTLANAQGGTASSIGIGEYEMRPIDQAHGFATFASGGIEREPYFVSKVSNTDGATLLEYGGEAGEQVFTPDVANDVTYALKDVASTSKRALEGGREVASKTGTVGSTDEDNSDAWMVGYTPSISTAVWMGNDDPNVPIVNAKKQIIYGSGLPGAIWQRFMNAVLDGTPEENLPDKPSFTGDTGEGVPEAKPTPTEEAPAPTSQAPVTTTTPTETAPTETTAPTGGQTGSQSPASGTAALSGAPGQPGNLNGNGNGNGN